MKFAILLVAIGFAAAAPNRFRRDADPAVPSTLIHLKNYANAAYWTEISIGTPAQKFKVALDTSSAVTFVPSADCDVNQPGCGGHARYANYKSSSYIGSGAPWSYLYKGNTDISGYYSVDKVSLADNVTVQYQTFGEAVNLSSYALNQSQYDGVLGLGFQSDDAPNSVLTNLVKANQSRPIFSLWLNKDPNAENGGELTLGGIDTSKSTGTKGVVNVVNQGKIGWVLSLNSVGYSNNPNAISVQENALVTPSHPFLSLPKYSADTLHQYLQGSIISPGKYAFDCNKLAQVPSVRLNFGSGSSLTIESKDFITVTETPMGKFCLSNIEGLASELPNDIGVIIGSVVLRQYYTIFDATSSNAQSVPVIRFGTLNSTIA